MNEFINNLTSAHFPAKATEMSQIHIQYHKSHGAEFILGSIDNRLCLMDFRYRKLRETIDRRLQMTLDARFVEQPDLLLERTKRQVDEYLCGERRAFDLPLHLVGTPFQKQVWLALMAIPYGDTTSYTELAQTLGNRNALRAVASANGANALALIVPCHRVTGINGDLVGYGGGLPMKQRLLDMELGGMRQLSMF